MPPEVERDIFAEAEGINIALIDNVEAAAELRANLLANEVRKAMLARRKWDVAVQRWRRETRERLLRECNDKVVNDADFRQETERLLNLLGQEQHSLRRRCKALMHDLAVMLPEKSTRPALEAWESSYAELLKKVGRGWGWRWGWATGVATVAGCSAAPLLSDVAPSFVNTRSTSCMPRI